MLKHLLVPGYGRPEPSILRTHPHTEERVERLEELADRHDRRALDSEDDVRAHRDLERVDTGPHWRPLGIWY
jgi:heat shock protein HtpX